MKNSRVICNSEAVSPVIGIMLMLVVTIIVAATVSAFAGGFADDQRKTPSAQIEVKLVKAFGSSGQAIPQLIFTHRGGDPIATSDLRIVTWVGGQKHVTDGSLNPADSANHFDATEYAAGNSSVTNDGYPCKMVNGAPALDGMWGKFTWMNGDVLTTGAVDSNAVVSVLGTSDLGLYRSDGNLHDTGPITVEIVHIPSGRVLSSSELMYV